jgi:hypothetical protein
MLNRTDAIFKFGTYLKYLLDIITFAHSILMDFSHSLLFLCSYVAENVMDMTRPSWPEGKELWSRGDENYPRRDRMPSEDTPGDLVSKGVDQ